MRKGISPLVASVLLIAITMAIAAILANWATSYTSNTLPTTSCIGGSIGVVSAEYPKVTGDTITAVVEASAVSLEKFKFIVLMNDDSVITLEDVNDLSLEAGEIGTIVSESLSGNSVDPDEVRNVQITTSCADVKSGWYELQ